MHPLERISSTESYRKPEPEELFSLSRAIPRMLRLIPLLRENPSLYHSRLPFMSLRYCLRGRAVLVMGQLLELWEQGFLRDGEAFYFGGSGNAGGSSINGVNVLTGEKQFVWTSPTALSVIGCKTWGCMGEQTVFPPEKPAVPVEFSELLKEVFRASVPGDDGTIPAVRPLFLLRMEEKGCKPPIPVMRFVQIPSGEFAMGYTENRSGFFRRPFPGVHTRVEGFEMMNTPVTRDMWNTVTGEVSGRFPEEGLPVNHLNWHEADAFARILSSIDPEYDYRLPLEAEWEYACRAGSMTDYHWGDQPEANPLQPTAGSPWEMTGNVGLDRPNQWGLHDMGRVVGEWCSNRFQPVYPHPYSRHGWIGKGYRAVRGGVNQFGTQFTSSWSGGLAPWLNTGWKYGIGMRLVRTPKRVSS